MQLTEDEVLSATLGLYADRLKPYGRILLRRIGERACAQSGASFPPFICAKELRALCEGSSRLLVRPEEAREYSVVLADDSSYPFVDPADKRDPYPQEIWDGLAAHFAEGGAGHDEALPGSRYACAMALAELDLQCLRSLTLGEVNHVVALAMGSRKILGYSSGRAVPYHKSEAGIKLKCAANAMPVPTGPDAPLGVASWEVVRACLWELLSRAEEKGKDMPLQNVKRLFRSEFGLSLSETALGHQRLLDLLEDPRLHDVCALRRRQDVHQMVVVEKAAGAFVVANAIGTSPLACPPMCPLLSTAPQAATAAAQLAPPASSQRSFVGLPAAPCLAFTSVGGPTLESEGDKLVKGSWILPGDITGAANKSGWEQNVVEHPWILPGCVVTGACPGGASNFMTAEEKFMESPWLLSGDDDISTCTGGSTTLGHFASLMKAEASESDLEDASTGLSHRDRAATGLSAGSTTDLSDGCFDSMRASKSVPACGCVYEIASTFVHVPGPESEVHSAARRLHRSLPPSVRLARHAPARTNF
jgi:hypothetical protein